MSPKYTPRTGEVFVRNFDEGVFVRLGAYAATKPLLNFGSRNGYWVDLAGTVPTSVPVIFNDPEQIYEKRIYPSISIVRESVEPDMARWHSVKQLEYFTGVSGTEETIQIGRPPRTVSGFSQVEWKAQAWPFMFHYTLTAFARYEHEAQPLLRQILKHFTPYSRIPVVDSLGDTRFYTTFGDGGFQDQSENADVADRLKAYSCAIRVEGELDLSDPIVRSTVATFVTRLGVL